MHLQGNDDGAGFGVKGTSLNNTGVLGKSKNGAGVFGSSIGARWLKPLYHFTRLSALLTIALVVAGAKAQANGFYPGERIGAVSRSTDTLDVFTVDWFAAPWHASWDPSPKGWQGWYDIHVSNVHVSNGCSVNSVTAVSPTTGEFDLFTVDDNGYVYRGLGTVAGFYGWSQIGPLVVGPYSYVSAVSRSTGKFDLFTVDENGRVWTFSSSTSLWFPLPGIQASGGTPMAAASPVTDEIDIFVVDANGKLQASWWAPYLAGWTSWQQIGGVQLNPGAPVTAISRGSGQLELFVTDVNGNIQTTTVYPSFTFTTSGHPIFFGWVIGGWKSIGVAAPGATVTGVSRHPGQLDIFVVWNQQVWTQGSPSLSAGFNINSWRQIAGLTTWEGSAVTAVSRSLEKLDVFVIGFDNNLWTGAWEPDFVQPAADAGVSDWHVFQVKPPLGLPAYY